MHLINTLNKNYPKLIDLEKKNTASPRIKAPEAANFHTPPPPNTVLQRFLCFVNEDIVD